MKHKNAFVSIKRVRFPNVGINIFIWELHLLTMIMPSVLLDYICSKIFNRCHEIRKSRSTRM